MARDRKINGIDGGTNEVFVRFVLGKRVDHCGERKKGFVKFVSELWPLIVVRSLAGERERY